MNAITFSRDEWASMLAAQGYTPGQIAALLGVSRSTVIRILHPEKAERQRQQSREAKRRRTGTCEDCGGATRYNGHVGTPVSRICAACKLAREKAAKVWTHDRIVDAVRRFAAAHGRPPTADEWVSSDRTNGYPPRSNVYGPGTPFAKWADAIEAAGYERPTRGRRTRTKVPA